MQVRFLTGIFSERFNFLWKNWRKLTSVGPCHQAMTRPPVMDGWKAFRYGG